MRWIIDNRHYKGYKWYEFKKSIDKLYKTISINKDLLNYSNEIYYDFFDYILVLIRID